MNYRPNKNKAKWANQNHHQCFRSDRDAKTTQHILNQIMVGCVLIVDVKIKAKLDAKAKIYNHQN
jgi:hypothetical protein